MRIVNVILRSASGDERYMIQHFAETFSDFTGTRAKIIGSNEAMVDVLMPLADDQVNEVLQRLNEYPGLSDRVLLKEGMTLRDAELRRGDGYEDIDVGPSLDSEAPITRMPR